MLNYIIQIIEIYIYTLKTHKQPTNINIDEFDDYVNKIVYSILNQNLNDWPTINEIIEKLCNK